MDYFVIVLSHIIANIL